MGLLVVLTSELGILLVITEGIRFVFKTSWGFSGMVDGPIKTDMNE